METVQDSPSGPITPLEKEISINGVKYSYLITKSEKEEESLIIKLDDPNHKTNLYFTYEASIPKLTNDIKFLALCENLDEMIDSLKEVFSQGNAQVEEDHGEFHIEFKVSGIKKKCIIQLTKHEIEPTKKPLNDESRDRIDIIENKINDLYNKYEELKTNKENDIRNIIKEIIFDKDIKNKLFEEMKQMLLSEFNLNNISNNKSKDNKVEDDIINKVQKVYKKNEEKLNNDIIVIQKQLKENIQSIKEIKSIINNYIILEVNNQWDLNYEIKLFNQVSTYKYYCNFERDDIEVIIDNHLVPVIFKDPDDNKSTKTEEKLKVKYSFYWKFSQKGKHIVKIIFKKKLLRCNDLFNGCDDIYKIDCSNFDCSQIIDCSRMFYGCRNLIEINLGKLDFAFSSNFCEMFYNCSDLEKLNVSYLNTQNSKSFERMFCYCYNLKEINVSNFKTTCCENINKMFYYCKSLESIDMLNWDMKNMKNIDGLFYRCRNLKSIKMNFNNNNPCIFEESGLLGTYDKEIKIFWELPEGGSFVWKKGVDCNKLLKFLPENWNRTQE